MSDVDAARANITLRYGVANDGLPQAVEAFEAAIRAEAGTLDDDERLGDALHAAFHPGHPWSRCNNPDAVYALWLPTFRARLAEAERD